MGDVYLADDTKLNRRVALKFLPSHLAADTTLRARFTREVQAVAALNHPNIVHVYEVSEFNKRPFFAMEYVEGDPLREYMRAGKMSLETALTYIIGLCEGLEAAHKVGIVHRDIKPANIVVANTGRVKILDFGLAKRASDPTLTSMGSTLGTICYMSPEQVQGKESDNRSDLFSVGIVLYEMVAGRLPFRGDYDAATLTAIVSDPHEPLVKFRPDAPAKLTTIVDRLLAKDPAQRYLNVTLLLDDLESTLDDLKYGAGASRGATAKPKSDGAKSNRTMLYAGVGAAVVIGAVAAIFLMRTDDTPKTTTGTADPAPQSTGTSTTPTDPLKPEPVPQQTATAPSGTTVDRSTYIAESIATANESLRLRLLRDSIEKERASILEASRAQRVADSILLGESQRTANNAPVQNQSPPPAPATPPTASRNRTLDSTAINAVLTQFWQSLESGKVRDFRKNYPDVPRDWETTWGTFVDYAKDLDVKSSIGKLKFDGEEAETTNQVKMTFRDRSGQKTQDVRYTARLERQGNQWIITDMEQNR